MHGVLWALRNLKHEMLQRWSPDARSVVHRRGEIPRVRALVIANRSRLQVFVTHLIDAQR
jgi:hypothetical protein